MRFLVSAALILSVFASALPRDPQNKSAGTKTPAKTNQRGTDTVPLVVKVLPTKKTDAEAAQDKTERENKKSSDWWLVKLTGALAIIGGIQIIVFGLQARRLHQTVEAMGRQEKLTADSVTEMRRSANAAQKSAEVSEQALIKTQRAFVFAKGFQAGTNSIDDRLKEYLFFVIWENVGPTPATDVQAKIDWQTFPMIENREPAFDVTLRGEAAVLGPWATAQSDYVAVPVAKLMELWRNQTEIFIYSRVEYRDVFTPEIPHHQEQCARVTLIHDPSTVPPPGHPPYSQLFTYGPQNSAA